jgi:hypothetical protein
MWLVGSTFGMINVFPLRRIIPTRPDRVCHVRYQLPMTSFALASLRLTLSIRVSKAHFFSLARPRLLSNHTPGNCLLLSAMPAPSRSSSKRKIENDEESDPEVGISQSSQISKKIRKEKSFASENSQPTNKVLPAQIVLPEKLSGTSRVVTWNVSGFAASSKKVSTRFFLA